MKDSLRVTRDICTSAELAPHLPDSCLHPDALRRWVKRVNSHFLSLQSLSSRGSGRKQHPGLSLSALGLAVDKKAVIQPTDRKFSP